MKKVGLLLGLLAFTGIASAAYNSTAQQLIDTLTHNQAKIEQSFTAVGGLHGFVVAPKQGGPAGIVYTNANNQYLITGNVFDAKGNNLTEQYTNQYIYSKMAQQAYTQGVDLLHWFSEGVQSAPHKAYVLFDPNCAYCHMLYQELQPLIQKGVLQIRWIPVAIRPNSTGKSARILYASTNKARAALLAQDEASFDMQTEQGGLKALQRNSSDPAVDEAYSQVADNTHFFISQNYIGTPVILYRDHNGTPQITPGYLHGAALQDMINKMASEW